MPERIVLSTSVILSDYLTNKCEWNKVHAALIEKKLEVAGSDSVCPERPFYSVNIHRKRVYVTTAQLHRVISA